MKEIPLTRGQVAFVDNEDYERVSDHKWFVSSNKGGHNLYAATSINIGGQYKNVRLHHFLFGMPPVGKVYDHINGNGLDNRRENLIIVTQRQNGQNKHIKKSSKYPGVSWNKKFKKWQVRVRIGNKKPSFGYFTDEEKAFDAYKAALFELGEDLHIRWV